MALVSPRRRARGVVWPKVAIVVVLCAIVGATSFQSNENLSSLTARTQPAPGGADGTEHASAKATAAGHGSTQEAGGAATDRQPDGTAGAEPDGDASAEAAESSGDAAAQSASDSKAKPLLYFDVGHAYHHLPVCPPGWERPGFACDASPCPVPWEYTEDKGKADVVLFNTLDGMTGWGDAGSQRPGQWVVLYAMESGQYYPAIYTAKEHGANITADYRLDSDVVVPYYSRWEYANLSVMPVPFSEKRQDGLIAVFISNCGPKNDREKVLARLMELLPDMVHSYGGCQHNREANDTKLATFATYKFAYTPENSNDPGYVTEKLYHALIAGTVPIYIGAPDVDQLLPDHDAIIRVSDFSSTEELATYLKRAAGDEAVYNKHIAWKSRPESEWSEGWQALQRLTQYSAHCRIAMHVAGRPHKWRDG